MLLFIFIHVFIEISVFIGIYNGLLRWNIFIYLHCISTISTVFIGLVFICGLYIFIHIYWVGSNFLLFNTCTIKFIEGKFYSEGRACYIGKIMPTCIE